MVFNMLSPCIILALGAMLALLAGSFSRSAAVGFVASGVTLLATALHVGLVGAMGSVAFEGGPALLVITPFGLLVLLMLLALGFLCLPLLWQGFTGARRRSELAVLMLIAILGGGLLVSANHVLMLYVALELLSFPLYILCAWQREDAKSSEAGLKYFVLGSLASGLMLFGGSFVYAATGAMDFYTLATFASQTPTPRLLAGVVMMLVGIGFKLSWVPFHFYTPDVYEGAPTPVTAMLAALPKLAVGALLVQLAIGPLGGTVGAVWVNMLAVIAVASMTLGATLAIVQGSLKRLLAYSTIANMGFVAVAIVALLTHPTAAAVAGVIVYLFLYGITSVGIFAAIQANGLERVEDLKGLAKRKPYTALAFGALLFSLAGIPPLAGFMGKFMAFMPAMQAGWSGLVLIAVLMSVVASVYSLWLLKVMIFDAPVGKPAPQSPADNGLSTVVWLCAAITLGLGVYPAPLVNLCLKVAALLV